MRTRGRAHEVDGAYALFVTTTTVTDGYTASDVATTGFPLRDGQGANGTALPEMRVEGSSEMTQTRRDWFVALEDLLGARERLLDLVLHLADARVRPLRVGGKG